MSRKHTLANLSESQLNALPINYSIRTMADLLAEVDEMELKSERARSVLRSNVRTALFIAIASKAREDGRSIRMVRDDAILASVPADVAWLNRYLYAYPAGLFGVSELYRSLSVSGLRRVLRHVGLIEPYTTSAALPGDSRWRQLLDRLAEHVYCQAALASFGIWCHSAGIEPESVSENTLEAFETFIRTRTVHSEIPRLIRTICKAWRKAAKLLQDWPRNPLAPPNRRDTYTLPFPAFPPSLQAEVDAFARWLGGTNRRSPFRGKGPRRPLRPSSVKIRLYCLRQAASALVLQGRDPATIVGLADLVEEAAFEAILQFYWDRSVAARVTPEKLKAGHEPDPGLGVTAQTGAIASTLMIVAKHYLKLDAEIIAVLRPLAQDVTPPPQTQLSAKNRERLRQFDDPVIRAKLLHLPTRLKEQIEGKGLRSFEAARLARVAAAIELLMHVPLRNANLTGLRLGVHLRYDGGRTGYIRHMVLQSHETKNRIDVEWPVGPDLAGVLDWYIKGFRPMLAPADSDWLFPAGFGMSGPLSREAMGQHIIRAVADVVGAIVNPHLFRCICARFILEHSPEALEDVRLMIGDKSLQVVLAHYGASQPSHAAQRTDKLLRRLRDESAHLVVDLAKPHRRSVR